MAKITIAVNGCSHGQFHDIFNTISQIEKKENKKIDVLLCCGDFESIRPEPFPDLYSMACPDKYLKYGDFIDFYNAEDDSSLANHPLTVFIGGNHESSHNLGELQYGGWVSKKIFYLGRCGSLRLGYSEENSVSLIGLSGIYKSYDFAKGLFEKYPLTQQEKKSVYHVRKWDLWRMQLLHSLQNQERDVMSDMDDIKNLMPNNFSFPDENLKQDEQLKRVTIGMSHEWPQNITEFANIKFIEDELVKRQKKDHLMEDIRAKKLGCPISRQILNLFQPNYWFSGHLHCDLEIQVKHPKTSKLTKFIGLDKVIPRRKFLHIVEIDLPESPKENEKLSLFLDRDWLSVIKATHDYTPTDEDFFPPSRKDIDLEEAKKFVDLKYKDSTQIPMNFIKHEFQANDPLFNPYTATLYGKLELNFDILDQQMRRNMSNLPVMRFQNNTQFDSKQSNRNSSFNNKYSNQRFHRNSNHETLSTEKIIENNLETINPKTNNPETIDL